MYICICIYIHLYVYVCDVYVTGSVFEYHHMVALASIQYVRHFTSRNGFRCRIYEHIYQFGLTYMLLFFFMVMVSLFPFLTISYHIISHHIVSVSVSAGAASVKTY